MYEFRTAGIFYVLHSNNVRSQDQGGGPNSQTGRGAPSSENVHKDSTLPASRSNASAGAVALAPFNPADVFVLEINNVKESFFLVAEYLPEHTKLNDSKHQHFETEYDRIHKASTALHITSLVILSFMVLEVRASAWVDCEFSPSWFLR